VFLLVVVPTAKSPQDGIARVPPGTAASSQIIAMAQSLTYYQDRQDNHNGKAQRDEREIGRLRIGGGSGKAKQKQASQK
jgi:hypothetical protein